MKSIMKVNLKQQAANKIPQYSLLLLILFPLSVESIFRRTNPQPNHFQPAVENDQHHHNQDNPDQSQDRHQDSSAELYDLPEVPAVTTVANTYLAPTDLDFVRFNDTSVVLKWDLTAHDQLQFFKIQYKSTRKDADWKTENREIPPTVRAYQIHGLRPGNYFFIVSAVYDNDDNVSSEQYKFRLRARSKLTADDLPEQKAPEIFWTFASYDYIRCKWRYPFKEKDIAYFGYLVYYRSSHSVADFTIYTTLDENVEIAELEPDTPYEVKIIATNQNGVSEFSEIKTIKTESKPNATTTSPKSSTTTTRPTTQSNQSPTDSPYSKHVSRSQSPNFNSTSTTLSFSPPTSKPQKDETTPPSGSNDTSSSIYIWLNNQLTEMDKFIWGHDHMSLAVRYTIFVFVPILLITFVLVCLTICYHRRNESPPPSTHASIQFDLEISGYFKNSFPGVEKEYSSMANHHAHHGFVNNHPHINDFA